MAHWRPEQHPRDLQGRFVRVYTLAGQEAGRGHVIEQLHFFGEPHVRVQQADGRVLLSPVNRVRTDDDGTPEVLPHRAPGDPSLEQQLRDLHQTMRSYREIREHPERFLSPRANVLRERLQSKYLLSREAMEMESAGRTSRREHRDAIEADARKRLANAEVRVRLPLATLPKLLKEGRFKTANDLPKNRRGRGGQGAGRISEYRATRRDLERHFFGEDANPIYGYPALSDDRAEYLWNGELSAANRQYGSVVMRLKPHVRDRSTWTAADSLNSNEGTLHGKDDVLHIPEGGGDNVWTATVIPSSINDPKWYSTLPWADPTQFKGRKGKGLEMPEGEVQIHGGLQLEDVEEVVFTTPDYAPFDYADNRTPVMPDPAVLAQLDAKGIKWRVVKGDNPGGEVLQESVTKSVVHVSGYTRRDGTIVQPYVRAGSIKELEHEWAKLDHALLPFAGQPSHPKARAIIDRQKQVIKAIHHFRADRHDPKAHDPKAQIRDVVVVGAGPAGLSASIYGASEGLDTLLIDAQPTPGGQARMSSRIENVLGFPAGITGKQLAEMGVSQAQRMGAEVKLGVRVQKLHVDPTTGVKTLHLSDGRKVRARAVVIAGGVQFKRLTFPGADCPDVVYGDSSKVKQAARGKPMVIVGGANSAGQAAIDCAADGPVYIVVRSGDLRKGMSEYLVDQIEAHPNIRVITGEIQEAVVRDDGRLARVQLKDGTPLEVGSMGVFIGSAPETDWVGADRDDHGFLQVGHTTNADTLETNLEGVFAAGDIRSGAARRVIAAAADGAIAVSMIHGYIARRHQRPVRKAMEDLPWLYNALPFDEADVWLELMDRLDQIAPFTDHDESDDVRKNWDPVDHPRDPRGRFVTSHDILHGNVKEINALQDELWQSITGQDGGQKWPSDDFEIALDMFNGPFDNEYEDPISARAVLVRDDNGRVVGAASYMEYKDYVYASSLATQGQAGSSIRLLRALAKELAPYGKPVRATPANEHVMEQYVRLGATASRGTRDNAPEVEWTPETLERLAKAKYNEAVALEESVKKAVDNSGGAMIAWYPPKNLAATLAVDNGQPPNDLHVTLAYLGDASTVVDPEKVRMCVQELAASLQPMLGKIAGEARFMLDTGGDCQVLLIDVPQLEDLHEALEDRFAFHGVRYPETHGFVPHMTVRYGKAGETFPPALARPVGVVIDSLTVKIGQDTQTYSLSGNGDVEDALNEVKARWEPSDASYKAEPEEATAGSLDVESTPVAGETGDYTGSQVIGEVTPFFKSADDVGPEARHKLRGLLEHYAKQPHPFTACVRDNRKRFGPGTEAVCATLKDMIRGTTHWRGHPELDHGAAGLAKSYDILADRALDRVLKDADNDPTFWYGVGELLQHDYDFEDAVTEEITVRLRKEMMQSETGLGGEGQSPKRVDQGKKCKTHGKLRCKECV